MTKKQSNLITTKEAAEIAKVSTATIRRWIDSYNIGVKVVGRYKVDYNRLISLMKGEYDD